MLEQIYSLQQAQFKLHFQKKQTDSVIQRALHPTCGNFLLELARKKSTGLQISCCLELVMMNETK